MNRRLKELVRDFERKRNTVRFKKVKEKRVLVKVWKRKRLKMKEKGK